MINPFLLVSPDWINDCHRWRGVLLTGKFAHWCAEWDDLPVDETCIEFEFCTCFDGGRWDAEIERIQDFLYEASHCNRRLANGWCVLHKGHVGPCAPVILFESPLRGVRLQGGNEQVAQRLLEAS